MTYIGAHDSYAVYQTDGCECLCLCRPRACVTAAERGLCESRGPRTDPRPPTADRRTVLFTFRTVFSHCDRAEHCCEPELHGQDPAGQWRAPAPGAGSHERQCAPPLPHKVSRALGQPSRSGPAVALAPFADRLRIRSCAFLDAGNFSTYLSTVKDWLDDNPDEVITLLLVNTDGLAPTVWAAAYEAAGMSSYVYTPSSVPIAKGDWPTLQSLISAGTRVVSFLAQEADFSSVPYLIDEFTNVWETPFNEVDASFPCTVDRVTGDYSTHMYLMNHFLDVNETILGTTFPVPATQKLLTTNAATGTGSLGANAAECYAEWGYQPTFTLVDFYDMGNGSVFQYAANINGVKYTPVTIGSGTTSSSGAKATTTSGDGSVTSTSLSGSWAVQPQLMGALAAAGGVVVLSMALVI